MLIFGVCKSMVIVIGIALRLTLIGQRYSTFSTRRDGPNIE